MKEYKTPLLSTSYLNENDLWDSQWLEIKYPEKFNKTNKQ